MKIITSLFFYAVEQFAFLLTVGYVPSDSFCGTIVKLWKHKYVPVSNGKMLSTKFDIKIILKITLQVRVKKIQKILKKH